MENASNGKMLQKGYEEEGKQEEKEPWNENKNGGKKIRTNSAARIVKKSRTRFRKMLFFLEDIRGDGMKEKKAKEQHVSITLATLRSRNNKERLFNGLYGYVYFRFYICVQG